MKTMFVLGSPNRSGNTAKVLSWIEDELRARGHSVESVNVGDGRIAPCVACRRCKRTPDKPGCAQDDGTNDILSDMLLADVVVLASPLYCWGISAQLKALIDRAYCMLKEEGDDYVSLLAGLRLALVVTGGGGVKGNLDLAVPPFRAFAKFFQCKQAGTLLVPSCTKPDALGPDVEKRARAFAGKLIKSVV
ncbi:MAG: flavodoxin family protein [Planctomycetota bacterium]|nr:flavodoxin family protein [Planctomycetota bacterium]